MEKCIAAPRVLIVDESAENREVLRAALERRGMRILEAQEPSEGMRVAADERPDLILLDADSRAGSPRDLSRVAEASETPLIVLGTTRLPVAEGEFVRKPYHYAPLIRKIEALLARAA